MARRGRRLRGGGGRGATIDMNSLIDLTFLLLVTFILTIPALEQGITIMLPKAKADVLPNKKNKANTVTLKADHTLHFNNVPVDHKGLEMILKEKVADDPDTPVLVRGDERLEYGEVMEVVKIVYKCKVTKMALVTVDK